VKLSALLSVPGLAQAPLSAGQILKKVTNTYASLTEWDFEATVTSKVEPGGQFTRPLRAAGKVGAEVSIEDAVDCARIAALNALAAVVDLTGDVDVITRIVKATIYIASAPDFSDQSLVGNGASDVLVEIFGDAGRHARSAVGVAALPINAPVEVELVVAIGSTPTIHPL